MMFKDASQHINPIRAVSMPDSKNIYREKSKCITSILSRNPSLGDSNRVQTGHSVANGRPSVCQTRYLHCSKLGRTVKSTEYCVLNSRELDETVPLFVKHINLDKH